MSKKMKFAHQLFNLTAVLFGLGGILVSAYFKAVFSRDASRVLESGSKGTSTQDLQVMLEQSFRSLDGFLGGVIVFAAYMLFVLVFDWIYYRRELSKTIGYYSQTKLRKFK